MSDNDFFRGGSDPAGHYDLMITELIKHYRAGDSKNIKHFILEDKS